MSASGRLLPAAVLAVPFLVAIVALQGLTVEIDTFHGTDAGLYHLPTIRQFADHVDLESYPAAQTPLYHLVFAAFGKVAGFELWKLRLLNAAISYGAALALLRLLRRSTPLEPGQALALTLVFTLSPYFFGASFTLLTDNLALLFAFVALERIDSFRRSGSAAAFAVGCLALSAAVLTRQSYVWLAALAVWFLFRSPEPAGRKLLGLGLVGAALAPLAALVVAWDGLVPRGSDPGSCGLCGDQPGGEGLTLRPGRVHARPAGRLRAGALRARAAAPRALPPAAVAGRRRRGRRAPAAGRVAAHLRAERPRPCGRRRLAVEGGRAIPRAGGQLPGLLRARPGRTARALPARAAGGSRVAAGGGLSRLPAGRPARAPRLPEVLRPDGVGHPGIAGATARPAAACRTTREWPFCAPPSWRTRSASRETDHWMASRSTTKISVSFGPIGPCPWEP